MSTPLAVVLLSGGLDSATSLAITLEDGYNVAALSFDYGQRAQKELACADELAAYYDVEHRVVPLALGLFGGSALTDDTILVPSASEEDTEKVTHQKAVEEIPVSYVPARNTILLAFALAYAEVRDASAIYIGVNAVDYSGYPDCRPEYIAAFQQLADLATKRAVEGDPITIEAPLQYLSKRDIVARGLQLGVPYEKTWSCYERFDTACGRCDSCRLRLEAFAAQGAKDPIPYRNGNAT